MARQPTRKAAGRSAAAAKRGRSAVPPKGRARPGKAPRRTAPPASPPYSLTEKRMIAALAPIPALALDGPWPNRRWTHEIKAHVGALGLASGHAVFADECLGAGAQWVFALCWVDLRAGRMRGIPLAMEVEWNLNMGEIAEDFDKLLQSRAQHRLLVFDQRNAADVAMVLKNLKTRIGAFAARQKGDRFLFAGYDFTGRQFLFDLHVV